MTTVYRLDYSGSLGKVQRTPQGGARAPATIAKVGILEYGDGKGGTVREYNPPDVLQAALESLRDAPVTNEHPPELVCTDNYAKFARGSVSGAAEFKDGLVHAQLAIQDAELLGDIEKGVRREISAGYSAEIDPTPGITPDGQPYDAIRTRIDFNHVAVVTRGRAGSQVRLVLDSAGNVAVSSENATLTADMAEPTSEEKLSALRAEMTELKEQLAKPKDNWQVRRLAELEALVAVLEQKFKVDGAEYAIKSAESVQTVLDGALAKRDATISKLEGERDAAATRADAAEAKVKELETKVSEASSAEKVDAAVNARITLMEKARKVCGDKFDATGKAELTVVTEVAAKAYPKLDLKDKSEGYVRALFDAAVSAAESDPDGIKLLRGERVDASAKAPEPKPEEKNDAVSAREEYLKDLVEAGRRPLKNG